MMCKEMRERTVHYCDICGEECGLPYYGYEEIGYGDCCSSLMRKIREAGIADELRLKVRHFGKFYQEREDAKELAKKKAEGGRPA